MKKTIKFLHIGLLSLLFAGFYSCNEFEEFERIPASSPATVEVTAGDVADSSLVVNIQNSSAGYVTAGIAPASTGAMVDSADFVEQNVAGFDYKTVKVEANTAASVEFTGLVQNTEYVVVVVGTNVDGVPSEVASVTVTTADSYAPGFDGSTPSTGFSPVLGADGAVTLTFDEPVVYDDTKTITMEGFFTGSTVTSFTVEVEGSQVTLVPETAPAPSDIIFLSWEEGTFSDMAGNAFAAVESGLDGDGYPYGLYYGVVPEVYEPVSVTPDTANAVAPLDFDVITIEFDVEVSGFDESKEVYFEYIKENGNSDKRMVTADQVTIDGMTVEITVSEIVTGGQVVEFSADEGAFSLGVGHSGLGLINPSAEIKYEWDIETVL